MTGPELRALRQAANVSQDALADSMGISQAMLSFIETGKRAALQATLHRAAALVHEMKAEADAAFEQATSDATG
jgi:transcriptional regulator with XRE-family HTH domain